MSKKTKKMTKRGMTAAQAIFAELEALGRAEQEDVAKQLLDWMEENEMYVAESLTEERSRSSASGDGSEKNKKRST